MKTNSRQALAQMTAASGCVQLRCQMARGNSTETTASTAIANRLLSPEQAQKLIAAWASPSDSGDANSIAVGVLTDDGVAVSAAAQLSFLNECIDTLRRRQTPDPIMVRVLERPVYPAWSGEQLAGVIALSSQTDAATGQLIVALFREAIAAALEQRQWLDANRANQDELQVMHDASRRLLHARSPRAVAQVGLELASGIVASDVASIYSARAGEGWQLLAQQGALDITSPLFVALDNDDALTRDVYACDDLSLALTEHQPARRLSVLWMQGRLGERSRGTALLLGRAHSNNGFATTQQKLISALLSQLTLALDGAFHSERLAGDVRQSAASLQLEMEARRDADEALRQQLRSTSAPTDTTASGAQPPPAHMPPGVTDPLTELRNRRHFAEVGPRVFQRARRDKQHLAILLVDIDQFKNINDLYGRAAGDAVLVATASLLISSVRPADKVFRWGGKEFLVLLQNVARNSISVVAERLRTALATATINHDSATIRWTASIGAALSRANDDTIKSTIKNADLALYQAKHTGRNRVVIASGGAPA